jgi:peptide-methionine (R)-S-oxide reductase
MSDSSDHRATRRGFLISLGVMAGGAFLLRDRLPGTRQARAARGETFPVQHTDAEWRSMLTPAQYDVLRQEGTERSFSSSLDHETRSGTYSCAGCQNKLFASDTKYDSGTGWPSFWQPLPDAVAQRSDTTLGMVRDEVHCRRCGGHLGHVFDDGPRPTGLRYCMNGVALQFIPAST